MTNFIPIFPLKLVVFPGENLNLHIFEPRYKQMIAQCIEEKKPFGIPTIMGNRISEFGTLIEITEVSKIYDNGEMDIKTKGVKVFRTLETINELPGKLYSGAIVSYPSGNAKSNKTLLKKIIVSVKELFRLLNITKPFAKKEEELTSFDLAHLIGLSLEQEYELLVFPDEIHRLEYIKRHLIHILPIIAETEALKARIKLNGHFKDLSASGFNI